jgi:hypothetical protein
VEEQPVPPLDPVVPVTGFAPTLSVDAIAHSIVAAHYVHNLLHNAHAYVKLAKW